MPPASRLKRYGSLFSRKGAGVLRSIIANTLARPRNPGSLGGVLAVGFADTAGLTEASLIFMRQKSNAGLYLRADTLFSLPRLLLSGRVRTVHGDACNGRRGRVCKPILGSAQPPDKQGKIN